MDARWKPMLCEPADAMPAELEGWDIEPKWDGWRGVIEIADAVTVYGGRNGNTYTGKVPYIEQALADTLPKGTVVDGELVSLSGWGSVQSVMTNGGAHVPSAAEPALTLVVFDVLQINGNDIRSLPREQRREILEMVPWADPLSLTPNGQASEAAHVKMLDLGMEGSVVKRRAAPYVNRRSRDWIKLKAIASEDGEIIEFEQGKGQSNRNAVGAFVVRLPTGVETTIKVPTDKMVTEVTAHPERFRGKVVEITHNGVMDSGKLRHPRFKRMRDDKAPEPKPKPKPATSTRKPRSGPWMRNYGAMGPDKASASLRELRAQRGDAYQRVVDNGGLLPDHLAKCEARCRALGLPV